MKNEIGSLLRANPTTVKRERPPHLSGHPRTGSGKESRKQIRTHLNFVSPSSMRFRRLMLKQQLGCGMPERRFAQAKPLCSK